MAKKKNGFGFFKFINSLDTSKLLLIGYISYIILGWLFLNIPFTQVNHVDSIDNLFISVSAVSTTGLVTVDVSKEYNILGQIIILILIQLGGLGYMTFGSFMILSTKKELSKVRKNILSTSFSLPKHFDILKFVKSIVVYTVVVEAIGALLLCFQFDKEGSMLQRIWNAVFHSVSAFCTAGFSVFSNSLENYYDDFWVNIIISILSLLGAIGYIVAIDVWLMLKGEKENITFTSRIIIRITSFVLLSGTFIIFITEKSIMNLEPWERIQVSFFQTMTALTTVGFNSLPISSLKLSSLILIALFMIIGASPSGTGGGIKSTTVSATWALMRSTVTNKEKVTFMNRVIPNERVIYAICSFVFYVSVLITGVYFLTLTEDMVFIDLFFESSSALGTVGLSTGITATLSVLGKLIIIFLMFVGRLGPISFGMALFYNFENEKDEKEIEKEEDIVV